MNGSLERIIDICLLDGKISSDEEKLIFTRAIELDENIEEIKKIIEEKKSKKHKNKIKYGDLYKCSNCGEVLYQYDSYCKSCGTSFKNEIQSNVVNSFKNEIINSENLVDTIKNLSTPKDINSLTELLMFLKSLVIENPNSFEQVYINDVLYYKSKEILLKISFSNESGIESELNKNILEISKNIKHLFKTSFYFEEIYLKKRKQFAKISLNLLFISLIFTWVFYFITDYEIGGVGVLLLISLLIIFIIKPIHYFRVKNLKNKVELLEEY
tara:strand:- start:783 stop:1592 length:810 start_codon:yes stop_codon:yes gene_type:complete